MNNKPQVSFVPTPIGNLGDITRRSVETMEQCDVIFAEDTRTARSLLSALNIKKPVESYHKDNEVSASSRILNAVHEGKSVCIISEAGTPCISDPGNTLTSVLTKENITFEALPGATAFIPALLMSGFPVENFYFHGFLPHKKSEKTRIAESLTGMNTVMAFYESPHRVRETLEIMLEIFPAPIFCAREISKIYESGYFIVTASDIEEITFKGEFVIIINNRHTANETLSGCSDTAKKLIKAGYEGKEAVNILKALGYKRNEAYSTIQDIINS
ncbi:Uroporphyrin-III C/tetrapyrrole (Corrin/Porphyrin) methyltransferase [Denitrovibrio acetiphilus DSM 12809]|uniref:Ribosomal RNA small subunit methyltransferase I n=1 Tax=Denitrovibrio acetiphilus (strain DSM 12809 / NBRC 114555 / N2460) TaxID=522772 RepID=D4H0J8_DENA2|nr:16S rRNA (cytidine(1402)-2'-O)-methyltransferase [Denitrovibrio acetiphilus]ADD68511.1 Uroporphyrin-III C/tetrapyrrole (Corrin/Porphyrin) methyltransferase [Denitrovibrio acetiphilus DSM 12809]